MMKNELRIDIFDDGTKVDSRNFPFDKGNVTVGRSPDADIIIQDTFVSKKHCQIKLRPESVTLEDLGSRNGTFVNGRKAIKLELMNGDKIQLGTTTFVINLPQAAATGSFEGKTGEMQFSDTGEFSGDEETGVDISKVSEISEPKPPVKKKKEKVKKEKVEKTEDSAVEIKPPDDYIPQDDEDDDEDDEAGIDKYFDLIPKLLKDRGSKSYSATGSADDERVEVISCIDEDILNIDELEKGKKLRVHVKNKKQRFVAYRKRGHCNLYLSDDFDGTIHGSGSPVPLSRAKASAAQKKGSRYILSLDSSEIAEINTDKRRYFVRFVNSPTLPEKQRDVNELRDIKKSVFSSVGLHLFVMFVFGIYLMIAKATEANLRAREEMDKFVKIDLKDLEPKPEATPTPKPTPVSTPAPKRIVEVVKKPKVVRKKVWTRSKQPKVVGVRKSKRSGGGGGSGDVNVAATGVLASLGGLSNDPRSSTNVVKAVSNLDAVKAPRGTRSNFSVSGLIDKSSYGDAKIVRISGPNTKGAIGGIDKQFGAIGTFGGKRGRGVGGVVAGEMPDFTEVGIRGSLTRDQIFKVVQKHVGELNYCYEKGLFDNPGIEGKLNMFWEIRASGSVGDVRIKRSSLKSTLVNKCVVGVIKKMQFPKPKGGGVVQVTWPFKFSAAAF